MTPLERIAIGVLFVAMLALIIGIRKGEEDVPGD